MNILFINQFKPTVNASGGIARVTINLGRIFSHHGYSCSLAYYNSCDGEEDSCFTESLQLISLNERRELERLASTSDLFIIQLQMSKRNLYLLDILNDLRSKYGVKIVYCHHSTPFTEIDGYDWSYLKYLIFNSSSKFKRRIEELLWCSYVLCFPQLSLKHIAKRRQQVADKTDMVVLLSEQFIPLFKKYVCADNEKITSIANSVTYHHNILPHELEQKEKNVLIVANMTERAKRVSMAIIIWHILSKKHDIRDWKLIVIGDGEDLQCYKRLAQKNGLDNCHFMGRQNPMEYYKKSRILMFTSAFEGFGMVITEAQQMGCVPVAFNTYESVYDLIEDGNNGTLIKYRDYNGYAETLFNLMSNYEQWHDMSTNCMRDKDKFTTENIFNDWQKLFIKMGLIKG